MAKTEHYYTRFEPNNFYHVYNRTVDKKPMFCNVGNYEFFFKRLDDYLSPVVDMYAYCLLGNHFHLLVRIHDIPDLTTFRQPSTPDLTTFEKLSNLNMPTNNKTVHDIVSHQFRKFFQSYSMAFNKQQERIGTLFQTPFKRALVDNEDYLIRLVYYIHANPQMHGLINDFRDWNWSSYCGILNGKPNELIKQEILNWFGSKKKYEQYHTEKRQMIIDKKIFLDDNDNEFYLTTNNDDKI